MNVFWCSNLVGTGLHDKYAVVPQNIVYNLLNAKQVSKNATRYQVEVNTLYNLVYTIPSTTL